MSTAAGSPSNGANTGAKSPDSKSKGKGKVAVASPDVSMQEEEEDEEEEDDDDDDEEMVDDDDEEEEEEEEEEVDPTAIVSGRRTRARIDYSSKEAYEKAGLKLKHDSDDEDDDEMK